MTSFSTDWLYVLAPLTALAAVAAWLVATGEPSEGGPVRRVLGRVGSSLELVTGLPAWCSSAVVLTGFALTIAIVGFLWDVGWHIDLGRDEALFTPAHTAILAGLFLILVAGVASATFARLTGYSGPGGRLIPPGAVLLIALGFGTLLGFPIDELWHRAYGVDVTMWAPTHLLMISGASLAPFGLWLLVAEAEPQARKRWTIRSRRAALGAVLLVALSTLQGEFDFGVPQFQQLYHPMLVALAASVALVVARVASGPGGAFIAVAGFLVIRGALAILVGPILDHTLPRFPLYLGSAVAVEAAFLLGRRMREMPRAVLAGAAVGTVGLAGEWAWMQMWGRHPWGASLWPAILVAGAIAVPGAILGMATGRLVSLRSGSIRGPVLVACGIAVVGLLVVPFPRHDAAIRAEILTSPAGPGRVRVEVGLSPADAATGADSFEVLSWQGGGSQITRLVESSEGRYRTPSPVPVGGAWKTVVRLARRDVMVATPVWMPADPAIGASEVPVEPRRSAELVRDTEMLLRETHDGPAWPAAVAYTALLAIAVVWIAALVRGFRALDRRNRRRGGLLAGRRVVITGALGGLGSAAAAELRREGASVMGIDLRPAHDVVVADVRDAGAIRGAIEEAAGRMGGIDILINNAGIGRAQDSGAFPDDDTRDVLEVNLLGTWNATAAALPFLLESRGHVVNVSSGLAVSDLPYAAAYAASKRGVVAYSNALRLEYRGLLTVTTVYPGYIRTAIHDTPAASGVSLDGQVPEDSPAQAARAIVRACTDHPRDVPTSGTTATMLLVARHFPRLAGAVVARRFAQLTQQRGRPAFPGQAAMGKPAERVG